MATYGASPGSWTLYRFYETNSSNQACTSLLTMPVDGLVTGIAFYANSVSGFSPTTFYGLVWANGGAEICASSSASVGAGTESPGGQSWITTSVSPTFIAQGTQIYIGWTRDSSKSMLFSTGSGTGYVASGGNPGSLGGLSAIGSIGAYIIYTPVSAPSVNTDAATSVQSTSVTLNGDLNPNGLDTQGFFQYGLTAGYGTTTANQDQGSGNSDVDFSQAVTGLAEDTLYHFRAVGSNAAGTTYGADQTFSTIGLPSTTLDAPATGSAANLVSSGTTFEWTYGNNGASGAQLDYSLQITDPYNNVWYWTGSAWTSTPTWITSTADSATITAAEWNTLSAPTGTFLWTVATQDANGKGAYATPNTLISEAPPDAPTLLSPPTASYQEMAGEPTLSWQYNASNAQGGQTAFAIRRKISGASTYAYWNSGTSSWVSGTIQWNTSTAQSYTFPAASWADGNVYNWSVNTQDAGGTGVFASDFSIVAQVAPTLTISAPSGTINQARPTVVWSGTFPAGASQTSYQVRTFSAAQYGADGFNPATSTATDDSGVVAGSAATSYQISTSLPIGSAYKSYVQLTETGSEGSGWTYDTSYTVTLDEPPAPVLTATASTDATTGAPVITLSAQCGLDILSAVDSSFETGIGSFAETNCVLAQSATHALDGTYSLQLTASSAATMSATSGTYAVSPGTAYSLMASFVPGTTHRSVEVAINWQTSGGGAISTSTGSAVSESTAGAWVQAIVQATSPSNAALATVTVTVLSPANTEIHYVDEVGLFLGTTSTWYVGGLLQTGASVVITRGDGLYVRYASEANPASVPNLTQLVTVNDEEPVPGAAYTYTAVAQAGTGSSYLASPASNVAGASVTSYNWWLLDPTNYATAYESIVMSVETSQTEQSAAHYPIGQSAAETFPTVVSSGFNGLDGTATFQLFTATMYAALLALLQSGHTLWLSSPFGECYYVRFGPQPGGMSTGTGNKVLDSTLSPSAATAPVRKFSLTWIAQPRPAV